MKRTEARQPAPDRERQILPVPKGRPAAEWEERAERAREARELGKKLREGKPILFPARHEMPQREEH
jgi:hypothetical protein